MLAVLACGDGNQEVAVATAEPQKQLAKVTAETQPTVIPTNTTVPTTPPTNIPTPTAVRLETPEISHADTLAGLIHESASKGIDLVEAISIVDYSEINLDSINLNNLGLIENWLPKPGRFLSDQTLSIGLNY